MGRRLAGFRLYLPLANFDHPFFDRPSRVALSLTSIGILTFSVLFLYAIKRSYTPHPTPSESCSSDCTIYASPSGNDRNSGVSPSSPKTFLGAAAAAHPGSTVCLLAGSYSLSSSFEPPASGTPSAWIVYKSCENGSVNIAYTGPPDASPIFRLGNGQFPSGPAYLEFRSLHLDGGGNAGDGFFCRGGHHLRFIGNTITNTGGSGIGSINCDYLLADHNVIEHNGYTPAATKVPQWYSWTSGISFNSNPWLDHYPGFHSVISNNTVSGEVDQSSKHTDGNGIILDLSNGTYDYASANTPPALVVNNVVYGNGGRCVQAYTVTNFWLINNTCYKNVLDLPPKVDASVSVSNSHDGYVVNNLAVAASNSNPCYGEEHTTENIHYLANLCFGSSNALRSAGSSQFLSADPLFLNAPQSFPSRIAKQNPEPRTPQLSPENLALGPGSPALAKGVDPSALPGLPKEIVVDLKKYIYSDFAGKPRPPGGPFALGAFQSSQSNTRAVR